VWDEVRILSHIGILARDVIVEGRAAQIGGIGGMMMYPEVRERDFATVGLRQRRHTRSRGSSLGLSGQQADLLGSAQATVRLFVWHNNRRRWVINTNPHYRNIPPLLF
jgi:hypothetical protein